MTKIAPYTSHRAALQRAGLNPGSTFHTGNEKSATHSSKILSSTSEETWGCLWTTMSRTKFVCFWKTWEIRNRSTIIFSHLNPFQSFLNSFVLSLNRKRKKKEFHCSFAQYIVWVLLHFCPLPLEWAQQHLGCKMENQVCPFSCTYPLLLDQKILCKDRGKVEVLLGMTLEG